jgi:hypothetical protein
MTAEIGHFAVVLALSIAMVQAIVPLVGAQRRWGNWMELAGPAALAQFFLILIAFAMLTQAFVTSDFSVRLVAANSHSAKPMLYILRRVGRLVRGEPAGPTKGAGFIRSINDFRGVPRVPDLHIQPVRAPAGRAG